MSVEQKRSNAIVATKLKALFGRRRKQFVYRISTLLPSLLHVAISTQRTDIDCVPAMLLVMQVLFLVASLCVCLSVCLSAQKRKQYWLEIAVGIRVMVNPGSFQSLLTFNVDLWSWESFSVRHPLCMSDIDSATQQMLSELIDGSAQICVPLERSLIVTVRTQ